MVDIYSVFLSKEAERSLKKIPPAIVIKLYAWIEAVGHKGVSQVRKISGYHDEP